MTVKELKTFLEDIPDDYDVAISVYFFEGAIENVSTDDDSKVVYLLDY